MRSYSFTCMGFMVALALACDSKPNASDTNDVNSSSDSTEGGTEGVSSTGGGTEGEPATTSGGSSATNSGTSVGTSVGSDTNSDTDTPETSTGTSGAPDPTGMTTIGTSQSSDATSDTDGEPPVPTPCEGEAVEIDAATLAYTWAQVPPQPDPTGGSSGTGGDPTDPDTLYVRLSSQTATCADPSVGIDCGLNWEVSIRIPPAFQTPGLYHLLGSDVTGTAMETGAGGGDDCSFGGGSFSATFELISVDDKEVVGRLCHVDALFFDTNPDLEGKFTAPRCQ